MRPCSAVWCGCTPPGQKPQSLVCGGLSVNEQPLWASQPEPAALQPMQGLVSHKEHRRELGSACAVQADLSGKWLVGWPSTCLLGSRAVRMLLSHRQWASSALVAVGLACLCWGCAMASLGSSSSSVRFPGVLMNERVSQAQLVTRP